MCMEGLKTDLSLIIKPARRSAAARAMVASFVTCGSRDEIRMSSMYTSHPTGQCFSADRVIAVNQALANGRRIFPSKGQTRAAPT